MNFLVIFVFLFISMFVFVESNVQSCEPPPDSVLNTDFLKDAIAYDRLVLLEKAHVLVSNFNLTGKDIEKFRPLSLASLSFVFLTSPVPATHPDKHQIEGLRASYPIADFENLFTPTGHPDSKLPFSIVSFLLEQYPPYLDSLMSALQSKAEYREVLKRIMFC